MNTRPEGLEEIASRWAARRAEGLGSVDRAELEHWLRADPRHFAALAEAELALSVLSPPVRTQDRERLRHEFAAWEARQDHGRRWMRRVALVSAGLAAAAALVVLVRLDWGIWKPSPPAGSSIATMTVRPLTRTLPDGSVVDLNAGANLAVEYSPTGRRVRLLTGEAHFAVAKDPARPFVVSAGTVEVRAVGTAFNVRFAPVAVQVLVTEGQVAVETEPPERNRAGAVAEPVSSPEQRSPESEAPAASGPPLPSPPNAGPFPAKRHDRPLLVAAGQRLIVAQNAHTAALPEVTAISAEEIRSELAWRQARLEFSDTTLDQAVALFNRQGGVQFAIGDAELKTRRISGLCSAENASQFAELLATTLDLRVEQEGSDRIVLRKR